MRIDKYLKITRIIKRRVISKEVIDAGFAKINGKIAKPSSNLNIGDIIEIRLGSSINKVEVITINEREIQKNPQESYKLIERQKDENQFR